MVTFPIKIDIIYIYQYVKMFTKEILSSNLPIQARSRQEVRENE